MIDNDEYYTDRNGGYRILVQTVDDSGSDEQKGNVQYISLTGRDGEKFSDVMRIQPHGFTSSPPKDSHGYAIPLGNKCELTLILGGEDPKTRFKGLDQGDSCVYNASKVTMHLKGNTLVINAPGDISITSGGDITHKANNIILDGNVTLGGPKGSGQKASMKGTLDSGGNKDVSNLANKVWVN